MNIGPDPLELPAGEVVLRSSAPSGYGGDDQQIAVGSGETVWLRIPAEGTES